MKVVIDNNIVIDALNPNPRFEADAIKILRLASTNKIDGFVCANGLADIFYVVRKLRGAEYAKAKLKGLMSFTFTIPLTGDDCACALELPMADFEDALVSVCAAKVNADCIITRDEGFLKAGSPVRTVSPGGFLSWIATGKEGQ